MQTKNASVEIFYGLSHGNVVPTKYEQKRAPHPTYLPLGFSPDGIFLEFGMPSRSKSKGDREELNLVHAARDVGLRARRIPLSGAVEGFKGDVIIKDQRENDWTIECKHRAAGFKTIYAWLADYIDVLTIRADRQPRLVVMREDTFFELLQHDRDA